MNKQVKQALESIGNKGRYQWITFFILFMLNAFVNLICVGPTLIFMNPLFRCAPDKTILLDESEACNILDKCQIQSPFTIVGHLNLYCNQQTQRNLIQSVLALGSVAGFLIVTFTSDKKGRRTALLLTQITAIFGTSLNLIGAELKLIPVLIAAQFFCGFSGFSMMLLTYIYPAQCFEDVFRQKAVVALNYSWCATFSLLGILYYWYNEWFQFLVYISLIPMSITLLFSFFLLVQGPSYLYNKKEMDKCLISLKFIATINGTLQAFQKIAQNFKFEELQERIPAQQTWQSLKEVLHTKKYLTTVVCLSISEMGAGLNYWASNYAFDQIGYEYGTNMIAVGILQCFSFISLNLVIEKIPRKKTLLIFYNLMVAIGFLFFITDIKESKIGSIVVLGVIRYIGTMAFTIIIILLTESFPMKVQSICVGIIESFAQIGTLLGPIVATICINMKIYPTIVLSVIIFVTVVIPVSLLNEPKHTRTTLDPNQVQDLGEQIYIPPESHEIQSKNALLASDKINKNVKQQ